MACTCQIEFQLESNLRFERTESCGDPAQRDQEEGSANRMRRALFPVVKIALKRRESNSPMPGSGPVSEGSTSPSWPCSCDLCSHPGLGSRLLAHRFFLCWVLVKSAQTF